MKNMRECDQCKVQGEETLGHYVICENPACPSQPKAPAVIALPTPEATDYFRVNLAMAAHERAKVVANADKQRHKSFVHALRKIQAEADKGYFKTFFDVFTEVEMQLYGYSIADRLRQLRFDVEVKGTCILVSWENPKEDR